MGLRVGVMEFRFPSGPPTFEQIQARLERRCSIRSYLYIYDGPGMMGLPPPVLATLALPELDASAEITIEGDTIRLQLNWNEPRYFWAQLGATIRDLGGTGGPEKGGPDHPAWATEAWPDLCLARRLAIRYRGLPYILPRALWSVVLVLLLPVIVISELFAAIVARLRRLSDP